MRRLSHPRDVRLAITAHFGARTRLIRVAVVASTIRHRPHSFTSTSGWMRGQGRATIRVLSHAYFTHRYPLFPAKRTHGVLLLIPVRAPRILHVSRGETLAFAYVRPAFWYVFPSPNANGGRTNCHPFRSLFCFFGLVFLRRRYSVWSRAILLYDVHVAGVVRERVP